jgi:uncharacterized membrane protein
VSGVVVDAVTGDGAVVVPTAAWVEPGAATLEVAALWQATSMAAAAPAASTRDRLPTTGQGTDGRPAAGIADPPERLGQYRTVAEQPIARGRSRAIVAGSLAGLAVLAAVGLAALWPAAPHPSPFVGGGGNPTRAVVVSVDSAACPGGGTPSGGPTPKACESATAKLEQGPDRGGTSVIQRITFPGDPALRPGVGIVLTRNVDPVSGRASYAFLDFQRSRPLFVLAAVFAVAVVALGRLRGMGALAGLTVSGLVVGRFVLPAILAGESPVLVALVGSAVILFIVLYVAHGVSVRTSTALLGTLISLLVAAGLATSFVAAARLTGVASEEAAFLRTAANINLQGVLLAGVLIGSLGVLNDVTVTQASAAWELAAADPACTAGRLWRATMRIGRDHAASSVYTLVLAYAGASLPLFLLFSLAGHGWSTVVTTEVVATEVIRTLTGAVALVLAVPITTGFAVLVLRGGRPAGAGSPVPAPPLKQPRPLRAAGREPA